MIDLSTTLGNAWFSSPLFTASGCASSGKELAQFIAVGKRQHGRKFPS